MKIIRRIAPLNATLDDLLEESFQLKENISPQSNTSYLNQSTSPGKLPEESRRKNHFGISKEELESDELEDVNWKTRRNVLEGDYQSAMPFKEMIWREQMIDLESQLNEQVKRLEQIRLNYDAEFKAKFSEHLKSCLEAKHMVQLTAPSMALSSPATQLESRTQSQFLVSSTPKISSSASTSFISQTADGVKEPAKSHLVDPSLLCMNSQSSMLTSPIRAEHSVIESQQHNSSLASFSFKPLTSTPKHDSVVTTQQTQNLEDLKVFSKEFQQSSKSHLIGSNQVPKSGNNNNNNNSLFSSSLRQPQVQPQQQSQFSESVKVFGQPANRSSEMISNDTISSSATNYKTSPVTFKLSHPALSRTDSGAASTSDALPVTSHFTPSVHIQNSNQFIGATESLSKDNVTSHSVKNITNEERELVKPDGFIISKQVNKVEVSDEKSTELELPSIPLNRPSIFENWFELTKQFEASIQEFNKSPNNGLRSDLKYTINERTAVWTKKFATEDEIQRAARFFIDLLSGITVFGFKDKRINLKGEDLARQWTIAYIIQAYINLVTQDSSLVDVVAAILSRIAFNCESFKSFLSAKLCTSSLTLSMDFSKCAEKIVELSQRSSTASEAISAWGNRENALIRLFAAVHSAACFAQESMEEHTKLQPNERAERSGTGNGVPLLWTLTVMAVKQQSALAATLITSLLTQSGWLLRDVYKKQFDKILAVIGEKLIRQWDETLKNSSHDVVSSFQRMWLTTLKDSYERGQFLRKPNA